MSISFSSARTIAKMSCPNCNAEIPADSRFCIECGAPAAQAATGATERLPEYANGRECPSCGTRNPSNAAFCFTCGRALSSRPVADAQASPLPGMPADASLSTVPPASVQPAPAARPNPGPFSVQWSGLMGGIWLIGIAVLAITRWWWPGIMVLLGLSALVSAFQAGGREQRSAGIHGAIWMFGIALIAALKWWWPGILVLIGLSAIVGAISRNDKAS
jgi:hypothetical protein